MTREQFEAFYMTSPPAAIVDEFMAGLLIRMWALASGRTLRSDVRPEQLSCEELIRFWADDLAPPSGRHAGSPCRAAGTAS